MSEPGLRGDPDEFNVLGGTPFRTPPYRYTSFRLQDLDVAVVEASSRGQSAFATWPHRETVGLI